MIGGLLGYSLATILLLISVSTVQARWKIFECEKWTFTQARRLLSREANTTLHGPYLHFTRQCGGNPYQVRLKYLGNGTRI